MFTVSALKSLITLVVSGGRWSRVARPTVQLLILVPILLIIVVSFLLADLLMLKESGMASPSLHWGTSVLTLLS